MIYRKKAVHAFLWYTIPIEWLITTTCSSLQSCVLYQAEAVASLLNNQAASISSSHWLWRYRVQADMPHIFSQAKPVEATATHHYRTTISSDFSWCSSSITTICTTTTTTPLAFRNLMDNLWEKGKKRKEYKPLQHQHQHTYYHTILLLSLLHQIYNYIYIYIYTMLTLLCTTIYILLLFFAISTVWYNWSLLYCWVSFWGACHI